VVALGSQSRQSDLVSLLIFWLFWVCDFCGFTVVVGGVFGLPWLWLGLSWVVGSCYGLWVWETMVVAGFAVVCGFSVERVFGGFLICCVDCVLIGLC
jgi:hypothetical protein